jgi:hypothetical protein
MALSSCVFVSISLTFVLLVLAILFRDTPFHYLGIQARCTFATSAFQPFLCLYKVYTK